MQEGIKSIKQRSSLLILDAKNILDKSIGVNYIL